MRGGNQSNSQKKEMVMTIQAQLKWTDGLQFVARSGSGPAVVIDSSDGGSGVSPMQMVLIGVAGCTAIDVIMIMKKKRADIKRFEVNVAGEMAESYPKRYTRIRIEYVLHGRNIKPKGVEQAIDLSEKKFCSAMASMNAEFEHSYRIVDV
jgi:putative redox protein